MIFAPIGGSMLPVGSSKRMPSVISTVNTSGTHIIQTFSGPVNAADWNATDFNDSSFGDSDAVSQDSPTSLQWDSNAWGLPLAGDAWSFNSHPSTIAAPYSGTIS